MAHNRRSHRLCLLCLLPLFLFAFAPLHTAAQSLSDSACGFAETTTTDVVVVATVVSVTDTDLRRQTSVAAWRPQHSGYEITVEVTVNGTAYEGAAALAYNTLTLLERTGVSSCSSAEGTVAQGRRVSPGNFAFAVGATPALQGDAWPTPAVELYVAITLETGVNVTAPVSGGLPLQCGCPDPDNCDTCNGGCSFECDEGTGRSSTAPKCRGVDTSAWLCIECGALQFQPDTTSNGSCMPCRKECDGESQWADLATCAAEKDSECKSCTDCKSWEEKVAPCADTSDRQCRKTQERVAMEELHEAVGKPVIWKLDDFHCDWEGVTCSIGDLITNISLIGPFSPSGDGGPLPSTVQALAQLKVLRLENVNLKGGVPAFLGSMKRLQVISFAKCDMLEGSLPTSLLTLPELSELNVADTSLSGPLFTGPKVSTSAAALRTLELSGTYLQGDLSPLQPINTTRLTLERDDGNLYLFECSSLSVALALEECTLCGVPPLIVNAGLPVGSVRIAYPPPAPDVGDTVKYDCNDEFATPTEAENTTFTLLCEGDIGMFWKRRGVVSAPVALSRHSVSILRSPFLRLLTHLPTPNRNAVTTTTTAPATTAINATTIEAATGVLPSAFVTFTTTVSMCGKLFTLQPPLLRNGDNIQPRVQEPALRLQRAIGPRPPGRRPNTLPVPAQGNLYVFTYPGPRGPQPGPPRRYQYQLARRSDHQT
jgi:hypothetical protein